MTHLLKAARSRRDWGVLVLLTVLVAGRLGFAALVFAHPDLAIANDTDRYVPIGNAILYGQALLPDPARPGLLLNTIGYPLFLAAVYLLLGHAPGDIALAQLLISGLMAIFLYAALSRTIGMLPALSSALILLVDPLTTLWSMTVLTETLLAFILGIAAVMITVWAFSGRRAKLFLAGLFSGLACLVKPYVLLIVGVWAVALLFYPRGLGEARQLAVSKGVKRALLFIGPTILLITPWIIRNTLIWDCPALSSVDRVTMRDYVAAKVLAESQHLSLDQAQAQLQASDPGVCPTHTGEYVNMILMHPAIYAKLHAAGTIPVLIGTNFDRWFQFFGLQYTLPDLWGPFVDGGLGKLLSVLTVEWIRFPQGLTVMLVMILFQLTMYALAVCGVLAFRSVKSQAVRWNIVILSLAILVLVLTPGQGGNERFRVPVQPLLAILTGYGMAWTILPRLNRARTNNPETPPEE